MMAADLAVQGKTRMVFTILAFQSRSLLSTAFFMETAVGAPLSFALMKVLAFHGSGGAITGTIWWDAAIAGMWATTTLACGLIGYQRFQGTLQYLVTSTLPEWAVFLPLVASAAMIGLVGLPVSIVTAWVFTGQAPQVNANLVLGYVLALLACCGSAAVLSSLFVLTPRATAFEPLVLIPIWLLCGIVVPVSSFPKVLQGIACLHPLTWAVWVAHRPNLDGIWMAVALGLLVSAIYGVLSSLCMRHALHLARVEGSLDLL
jgi:ABC-2 type transport system permease protein